MRSRFFVNGSREELDGFYVTISLRSGSSSSKDPRWALIHLRDQINASVSVIYPLEDSYAQTLLTHNNSLNLTANSQSKINFFVPIVGRRLQHVHPILVTLDSMKPDEAIIIESDLPFRVRLAQIFDVDVAGHVTPTALQRTSRMQNSSHPQLLTLVRQSSFLSREHLFASYSSRIPKMTLNHLYNSSGDCVFMQKVLLLTPLTSQSSFIQSRSFSQSNATTVKASSDTTRSLLSSAQTVIGSLTSASESFYHSLHSLLVNTIPSDFEQIVSTIRSDFDFSKIASVHRVIANHFTKTLDYTQTNLVSMLQESGTTNLKNTLRSLRDTFSRASSQLLLLDPSADSTDGSTNNFDAIQSRFLLNSFADHFNPTKQMPTLDAAQLNQTLNTAFPVSSNNATVIASHAQAFQNTSHFAKFSTQLRALSSTGVDASTITPLLDLITEALDHVVAVGIEVVNWCAGALKDLLKMIFSLFTAPMHVPFISNWLHARDASISTHDPPPLTFISLLSLLGAVPASLALNELDSPELSIHGTLLSPDHLNNLTSLSTLDYFSYLNSPSTLPSRSSKSLLKRRDTMTPKQDIITVQDDFTYIALSILGFATGMTVLVGDVMLWFFNPLEFPLIPFVAANTAANILCFPVSALSEKVPSIRSMRWTVWVYMMIKGFWGMVYLVTDPILFVINNVKAVIDVALGAIFTALIVVRNYMIYFHYIYDALIVEKQTFWVSSVSSLTGSISGTVPNPWNDLTVLAVKRALRYTWGS